MPSPEMKGIGFGEETIARPGGGDYYLFVIAIDKYEESKIPRFENGVVVLQPTFPNLLNPVLDASKLVNVLLDKYNFHSGENGSRTLAGYAPGIIQYNTIYTKCLYNEDATAANITTHLGLLKSALKKEDSLLIYFSGHGDDNPINPSGCLIPFDGIRKNSESNTWFQFNRLYALFEYPACCDLLVILDCCFAGKAFLGAKKTLSAGFSRKVLVSSSPQQTAIDGKAYEGSPFAKALARILDANTEGYFNLNIPELTKQFQQEYLIMYDKKPGQQVIYEQLPMDCGLGDFIFELKEKNAPPPSALTQTFVRHLNFSKEKKLLEDQFGAFNDADLILIITRESNKYIHELLRAVLFTRLCQFEEELGCFMNLSTCLRKSLPLDVNENFDVWSTLVSAFGGSLHPNPAVYVMDTIAGQLLDKPMVVSLYSNTLTVNFASRIISFFKEFIDQLHDARKRRSDAGYKDEKYHKLFFVVPDSRNKGDDFFKDAEIKDLLGKYYNLFINTPVEALEVSRTSDWFNAIKAIGSQNVRDLKPKDFFPDFSQKYSILDFIYLVCDKVKCDKIAVENAIINY